MSLRYITPTDLHAVGLLTLLLAPPALGEAKAIVLDQEGTVNHQGAVIGPVDDGRDPVVSVAAARAGLQRAAEAAHSLNDQSRAGEIQGELGMVEYAFGDLAAAERHLTKALVLARTAEVAQLDDVALRNEFLTIALSH